MADATITFGADPGNVPATVEQLRSIVEELFKGIESDADTTARAQEILVQQFSALNLSVLKANDAVAALAPGLKEEVEIQKQATVVTREHTFNVRDLSRSFLETISVATLLKRNYEALKPSLEALGSEFRNTAEGLGLSKDGASVLTNTLEMMVNPLTIVENLTANLKIAAKELAAALYDEASATDAATEAQQRKAGILSSVLSEQQKLVAEETKGQESLEKRTAALERQIQVEQQSGEVKKFYLDKLKAILDEYDRRGETPPQKTLELASALGVLSSEQEKAATAAEKHAGKVQDETTAVTDSGKAVDTLLPKLQAFADGKHAQAKATDEATAALRAEIQALADEAKAAEEASKGANQKAQDAAKRIKELEDQPVRTIDQQNELNSLKEQQVTLDQDAAEAADTAAQATFEYGDAQASLADATGDASGALKDQSSGATHAASVMAELDAATKAYDKTLADVGDQAQNTTAYVEAVGENGEKIWTNFTDTIVEGNAAIGDAADGLGKVPAALDQVTPAAERAGEGLAGLNEFLDKSEGGGFSKTATDVASMNEELEKSYDLAQKIRTEFERINSTISGAGG